MRSERVQVFYVSTSIKRAVATVWDELTIVAEDMDVGADVNLTNHTMRLPTQSKLTVTGVENKKMANDLRGRQRPKLWFLDECQDWDPELLRYFYESVIYPRLNDVMGGVIFAGTGGSPRGYWYERTIDPEYSHHRATAYDNPIAPPGETAKLIAKACKERGCDETDPSIRREFFAEFVPDLNRQIFSYEDGRNGFDREARPGGPWRFVLGADFGTVDRTAVHVWGWTPQSPRLWMWKSARSPHGEQLGASRQMALVRETWAEFRKLGDVVGVVGDPGGGGKALIEDMKGMFPGAGTGSMEPAEKTDKAAACMLMRDDLRNGSIAIDRSDREFIADLQVPEWDPAAVQKVVANHFPDTIDAALYAYRLARHHWYKAPAPEPVDPEEVAALARQKRMAARVAERAKPWTEKIAPRKNPRALLR